MTEIEEDVKELLTLHVGLIIPRLDVQDHVGFGDESGF